MEKKFKKLDNGKFEMSITDTVTKTQTFSAKEIDDNIKTLEEQLNELKGRKTEIEKLK